MTGIECIEDRGRIYHRTSGCVDQKGSRAQCGDECSVYQSTCFAGQRNVQTHNIGLANGSFERHRRGTCGACCGVEVCAVRVHREHPAPESRQSARKRLSGMSESDDGDGSGTEFPPAMGLPFPPPRANACIGRTQPVQQHEQESHRMFCHRIAVAFGRIEDVDAACTCCGDIDVLESRAAACDAFQTGQRIEQRGVECESGTQHHSLPGCTCPGKQGLA